MVAICRRKLLLLLLIRRGQNRSKLKYRKSFWVRPINQKRKQQGEYANPIIYGQEVGGCWSFHHAEFSQKTHFIHPLPTNFFGTPSVACHVFPHLCHIRKSHAVVITFCHVFPHLCRIRKSHVVVVTCCHVLLHLCISVNHMLL